MGGLTVREEPIRLGLRPEPGAYGYSATAILEGTEALINQGLMGRFPPEPTGPVRLPDAVLAALGAGSPSELFARLDPVITDLEGKLATPVQGSTR